MEPPNSKYARLSLVFCLFLGIFSKINACITHVSNPLGDVSPSADTMLQVGSSLVVNCTLYPENVSKILPSGVSSSNIRFKIAPEFGYYSKWLSNDNVHVLDENTAQLRINNLTMDHNGKYNCYVTVKKSTGKLSNRLVCGTAVTVGYAPLDIRGEDVSCTSYNWARMECTWLVPNNTIPTTYKFFYSYIEHGSQEVECKPFKNTANKCVMTVKANATLNEGFYRQVSKYYYFTIRGENIFGRSENKLQFNHYNFVKPNAPETFKVDSVQQRSLGLIWQMPAGMEGFPVGLKYQLMYLSEYDKPDHWNILPTTHTKYEVHNLIPYTNYVMKVRCASNSSKNDKNSLWGNFSILQHRTEPDVPRTAPNVTLGLFEDIQNRNGKRTLILYWQHVPKYLRNGPDFKYYVSYSETNHGLKKREADADDEVEFTTNFYAEIKNLNLESSYRFHIRVGNKEGSLPEIHSTQFINGRAHSLGKPTNLIVRLEANNIFRLTWKPPIHNANHVTSYTIFWCKQRPKVLFFRCKNPMDWVTVPADRQQLELHIPDANEIYYQFAISSNSEKSSSGMAWTVCSNGASDRVAAVTAIPLYPALIRVSWKTTCVEEKSVIKGYRVTYCKALGAVQNTCIGPTKDLVVNKSHVDILDAEYHTRYIIRVTYLHEGGESLPSDPVDVKTNEGVPENSSIISDFSSTNSSIKISWQLPSKPNGVIVKYRIKYSHHYLSVPTTALETLKMTLTDHVLPYTEYQISVAPCTVVGCAPHGNFIFVQTDIGSPGEIDAPRYDVINETFVHVSWKPPTYPNGPLDMVELNLTWRNNNETINRLYNITEWIKGYNISVECPILSNDDDMHSYNLTVRAVNIKDGQRLYGPWSEQAKISMCFDAAAMAIGFIIGVSVGGTLALSIVLLALYFVVRWTMQKMDEAKTIKVQLPKGLESNGMTALNTYKDFSQGLKSPKTANGDMSLNFSQYKPLIPNDGNSDFNQTKNRHESGDSAYSSNSTNELLRKRDRNGSNGSGSDASDNGSASDGLLTNIGSKTHLSNHSNDSGLHCDLDNSQPSPEPVFLDSSPNFKVRGSPPESSLKFKTPSLPIVNEVQDHESSPDDRSQNTEVSDDSGTAEMNNKPNQYSKFAHYHDKLRDGAACFPNSPTIGLALTDGLGPASSPYCKLGLNHLRGVYVPSHPGTASFLSKNSRNIAGSEPNIADADSPSDSDSGNSSVVNTMLPPYTRLGLASSHTDVSFSNLPASYSKFGLAEQPCANPSQYVPVNSYLKSSRADLSPAFYPAAPYSKFGLLNIPTNENLNSNPGNPYLTSQPVPKWDIPKPRNPGYVTVDRAEIELNNKSFPMGKNVKAPEMDEGYSRVSAGPAETIPVPRDVDLLDDSEPILCVQGTTGAIPKCSNSLRSTPVKTSDNKIGISPNDNLVLDLCSNDTPACQPSLNDSELNEQTATSTPKSSPQPSPSHIPKTNNSYVPCDPSDVKSNGYVSMPLPQTGIINPSNRDSNNQPLSCANLQASLTMI